MEILYGDGLMIIQF